MAGEIEHRAAELLTAAATAIGAASACGGATACLSPCGAL